MRNPGQGMVRLTFRIPARGLFGYRSEFLTDTRGTGIMHHRFLDYGPWAGPLAGRKRGVLVADREGAVVAFALGNLQERAQMFVTPGDQVYEGMIAGESSRPGDMDVNVTKEKKLTQHADDGVGRERHPGAAPPDHPRVCPRVHRGRRADRGHAQDDPAPEAGADGERPQEGRPGRPGGGRVLKRLIHSRDGGGHHVGLGDVGGRIELRRKFDDDEDEFEDDGFTFDDEDEDEDLDDEDDLDDDEEFDDEELEEFEDFEEDEER